MSDGANSIATSLGRQKSVRLPGGVFVWLSVSCGGMVLAFILLPLVQMAAAPSLEGLWEAALDSQVRDAIRLSLLTAAPPPRSPLFSARLWPGFWRARPLREKARRERY